MKIVFTTNLDAYGAGMFPSLHHFVPRVGEMVEVTSSSVSYCENMKIPRRLEVVRVSHREESVVVELWYNKTDLALFKEGGSTNLL